MTGHARSQRPTLSDLTNKSDDEEVKNVDPPVADSDSGKESDSDKMVEIEKRDNDPFLSEAVVSTVPNRTPAELAAESAEETAKRYNIDNTVSEEDIANPRVQVYEDTVVTQVPGGTHLHPDIAKDQLNRGFVVSQGTDNAQVKRTIIDTHDFAPNAEYNDKFDDPNNKK